MQQVLADAKAALDVVEAKLGFANKKLTNAGQIPVSKGWITDILGDSTGSIGLHRFQIAVWTVVLGIILMTSVAIDLSMPVFSPTLLALMGISAGTYLGFKFPEK